jgi:hypothetical protein
MKVGDLVRKLSASRAREEAGLGLVIDVTYKSGPSCVLPQTKEHSRGYKVQWSNEYGTFWASEDKLELVNGLSSR